MARFEADLPRPEDNTVTAVRHVNTMSPQEAASGEEELSRTLGGPVARFIHTYSDGIKAAQYAKGSLQVKQTLSQAATDATSDPAQYSTALPRFTAAKSKLALQIANAGYPESVAKQLQLDVGEQSLHYNGAIQAYVVAHQRRDGLLSTQQGAVNWITTAAQSGVDSPTYGMAVNHIALLGQNATTAGWLTKQDADSWQQKQLNALDTQTVQAGIDGGQAQQTLSNLQAGKYKYLEGSQRERYMKAAQDAIHAQQVQNSVGVSNLADNMVANYETTGEVTGQEIAAFNAAATPEQRARYTPLFAAARTAYTTNQSLQQLPLADQEAKVAKLQQTLKAPSNNQDAKIRLVNMVSREVSARVKAFHADPVSYAWSTPFGQQQSSLNGGQVNTQTRAGFLLQQKVVDAMYDQQQGIDRAKGQTPTEAQAAARTYLSKQDVASIRQGYVTSDPASAAEWLNQFDSHIPAAIRSNVEKQLFGTKGLPPSALIYSPGMPAEDFAALKTVDGMTVQTLKAGIKEQNNGQLPADAPSAIAQYWNQAKPALGMAGMTMPYGATYEKLTYYNIAQGMTSSQAAQAAFKTMFGDYTFNGKWMFPANTSAATQSQIQEYGAQMIEKTPLYGYEGHEREMRQEQAVLAKDNTWQYIPASNSYVLLNADGFLVRNGEGKPVSFNFADAQANRPIPEPAKPDNVTFGGKTVDLHAKTPNTVTMPGAWTGN